MTLNPNLYPSGGYKFEDANGVGHKAGSMQSLIQAVTDYRFRNGQPIGNPAREIHDSLCNRYPHLCQPETSAAVLQQTLFIAAESGLSGRVMQRLNSLKTSAKRVKLNFVDRGEAERRAGICMGCPLNKEFKSGCGGCNLVYEQTSKVLRGSRSLPGEEKLLACEHFGHDNRLEVWLEKETSGNLEKVPGYCWKR